MTGQEQSELDLYGKRVYGTPILVDETLPEGTYVVEGTEVINMHVPVLMRTKPAEPLGSQPQS